MKKQPAVKKQPSIDHTKSALLEILEAWTDRFWCLILEELGIIASVITDEFISVDAIREEHWGNDNKNKEGHIFKLAIRMTNVSHFHYHGELNNKKWFKLYWKQSTDDTKYIIPENAIFHANIGIPLDDDELEDEEKAYEMKRIIEGLC
jgi:hypothetical protein